MKQLTFTLLLFCAPFLLTAQAQEANMLYNWNDTSLIVNNWPGGRYNEIWGVSINGHEFGIIGSTEGVHFIDVTDPLNSYEVESAYVQGKVAGANIIHRDYHDYNGYLYTVADEGSSSLQVIDMTQLPDTAIVVYDDDEFFKRAHNIFIDSTAARLYATGGVGVKIISIEEPENPTLLASFPNEDLDIPYAHDLYVRDNIALLNCGQNGLWAVDFTDLEAPQLLGNMTIYEQQGYNHAGWMHETLPYYYLADETHGMDVKVVNVEDYNDMYVVNTFDAEAEAPSSIAHNVLVRGDYLYISYYYDGVQVYDITDPENPVRVYYFDTYAGEDQAGFHGAWGVFPYLTSGNFLVSDMQTGFYLFESIDESITSTGALTVAERKVKVWPQPSGGQLTVELEMENPVETVNLKVFDLHGKCLLEKNAGELQAGVNRLDLNLTQQVANGLYFLHLESETFVATKKIVVQK
ncbi:MAG: choice-of-anchor B family protein [Bacteroidetes bacterium]|nr:MAG: choice-of-anchor B family protein [Bacteroidota bacterium]